MAPEGLSCQMDLSDEQLLVVQDLCEHGRHVFVDAVAGSGKTTTILGVAAASLPSERILLLTYNAKLKFDTRTRVSARGLAERVHVHSYHSAALHIYSDPACKRDEGIEAMLDRGEAPVTAPATYHILVIDEVQDMTPLYHRLVCALVRDVCVSGVRLLVLGDRRQAIYKFKGSDVRFLTLAPDVFPTPERSKWVERTLSMTYRLTASCARFVNMHILGASEALEDLPDGGPAMRTRGPVGPDSVLPRYLLCNAYNRGPYDEVARWMRMGVLPGQIFVLAPSTRNNALVRNLENRLVQNGVMCYATCSDDAANEVQDERVTRGKIVFATFHQAKGLERRATLVFGFDAAHSARQQPPDHNPIYVAVTRSTEHLTVVHHCANGAMPCVRSDRLRRDCTLVVPTADDVAHKTAGPFLAAVLSASPSDDPPTEAGDGAQRPAGRPQRPVAVTDLLRFMPPDVMARACGMLTFDQDGEERAQGTTCVVGLVASVDGETAESVAAITGIALPALFEADLKADAMTAILRHCARNASALPQPHRGRICRLVLQAATQMLTTSEHLYVANVYHSLVTGFRCKLQQVKDYDWLDAETVTRAMETLGRNVGRGHAHQEFEVALKRPAQEGGLSRALVGAADLVVGEGGDGGRTLWEFKCTHSEGGFDPEHQLQLAMYAYMAHRPDGRYKLLNILTGDVAALVYDERAALAAIEVLLAHRAWAAAGREDIDDVAFTDKALAAHALGSPGLRKSLFVEDE